MDSNKCKFRLQLQGNPHVGWIVSTKDRCLAGHFTPESSSGGQELFIRNDDHAVLLIHRKAQWLIIDFHRIGRDIGDPVLDYIQDNLSDVFIHNAWGTGMIGVNHAQWNPSRPDDIRQEIRLTWINHRFSQVSKTS